MEVVRYDDQETGARIHDGRGANIDGNAPSEWGRRRWGRVAVIVGALTPATVVIRIRIGLPFRVGLIRQLLQFGDLVWMVRIRVAGVVAGPSTRRPPPFPALQARNSDISQGDVLLEDKVAHVLLIQEEQTVQKSGAHHQREQHRDVTLLVRETARREESLRVAGSAYPAQGTHPIGGAGVVPATVGRRAAVVFRAVLELNAVVLYVAPEVRHRCYGLRAASSVRTRPTFDVVVAVGAVVGGGGFAPVDQKGVVGEG